MKKPVLPVPAEILTQHIAALGKTGSGKTSTAKLLVEHVVAEGARVCVLDPIKSDWWGLISSADGKRAGLPFHILGGPQGHVPLHESAGAAIAEIVANGALPLSVIDMADFKPGGQAQFFVDFAPTLLRKMRGVVYLVLEEAHLFAPKERSGIGSENMSVHWAKMLATAGRSKGIRLIVVTQRTQALHNALLGSCDTMLAHRLTAPADQKPVVEWLKANTSPEIMKQVSSSLASLKTGDAWVCSGEAKYFEIVHFPRISTYDNTATPTGDGQTRQIKMAAVDQDKLRAIIGDAIEEAKANDPKELKKEVARLKGELAKSAAALNNSKAPVIKSEVKQVQAFTDADRTLIEKLAQGFEAQNVIIGNIVAANDNNISVAFQEALKAHAIDAAKILERTASVVSKRLEQPSVKKLLEKLNGLANLQTQLPPAANSFARPPSSPVRTAPAVGTLSHAPVVSKRTPPPPPRETNGDDAGELNETKQRILDSLAWWKAAGVTQPTRHQVAFGARYTVNGHFRNELGALRSSGLVDYPQASSVALTVAGDMAAHHPGTAANRQELIDRALQVLRNETQRRIFAAMVRSGGTITREDLAAACEPPYTLNGHFRNELGALRSTGLVRYPQQGTVSLGEMFDLEA